LNRLIVELLKSVFGGQKSALIVHCLLDLFTITPSSFSSLFTVHRSLKNTGQSNDKSM